MIRLNKDDLHRALFSDVVFFMYAAPGAMVCEGEVCFVTRDGTFYGFNYLRDDIDMETFNRYFPLLTQCRFNKADPYIPAGWYYKYLGVGRSLFIEETVYPEFEEQTIDYPHPYELGTEWWGIAKRILCGE